MKLKTTLLLAFLLGCATTKLVEFASFKDAVAKTKARCHYIRTESSDIRGEIDEGKVKISYSDDASVLIKNGWRAKTIGGGTAVTFLIWEKCSR